MLEWNDYPVVLAIARAKSLYRAALKLDVAVSTVMRRLEQIEARAGLPLFQKTEAGYVPTSVGQAVILKAEDIERIADAANASLEAERSRLRHKIRISSSEVIAPFFVSWHLPALRVVCPEHEISLTVTDQSPSKVFDSFDISLWPSTPSNEDLFGRKLTDLRWALYGSEASALKARGAQGDHPRAVRFFGRDGAEKVTPHGDQEEAGSLGAVSTNALVSAAAIAARGDMPAYLPCILGARWPGLQPLGAAYETEIGELWAIYRKADRKAPHIRAVVDALLAAAQADRDLFLGH